MLVGDGLHPSAAMYARWLVTIQPQARAALDNP
jgi:lysophospholipase L1-like esterase